MRRYRPPGATHVDNAAAQAAQEATIDDNTILHFCGDSNERMQIEEALQEVGVKLFAPWHSQNNVIRVEAWLKALIDVAEFYFAPAHTKTLTHYWLPAMISVIKDYGAPALEAAYRLNGERAFEEIARGYRRTP